MENRQNIYIIKQDIQMFVRIAGQRAGPIGLIFLCEHSWVAKKKKNSIFLPR